MKNVQISQELFVALLHYHLSGENEYEEIIEQGLEQKLDAMLRHELYAQYKTAPTEEQREQARQEAVQKGKLYGALGLVCGCGAVLLLI